MGPEKAFKLYFMLVKPITTMDATSKSTAISCLPLYVAFLREMGIFRLCFMHYFCLVFSVGVGMARFLNSLKARKQ